MKLNNLFTRSVLTGMIIISSLPMFRAQGKGYGLDAAMNFSALSSPQNMGAAINAPEMDQTPAPAPSGLSLYFTSSRLAGGQGGSDVWVSQRPTLTSAWGAAQNLGVTLNTGSNDTVTNISPDGLEMYITSNRPGGSGGPDLYVSSRTDPNDDFGWTAPVSLGPVINSGFQDVGGVFFEDRSPRTGEKGKLYFWSDRAEIGLGDIYESSRNADGSFNAPARVNSLNSAASERGIAISSDGLDMYISSTRLGPATTFAIFVSSRRSTRSPWKEPVAVEGLNTAGSNSQPALSADGTILYFVSNRPGGFGSGDLYSAVRFNFQDKKCLELSGSNDREPLHPKQGR